MPPGNGPTATWCGSGGFKLEGSHKGAERGKTEREQLDLGSSSGGGVTGWKTEAGNTASHVQL